jgi:hypothetical protein
MALLNESFRADDLPPSGNYDPIPAGKYQAKIAEASVGLTKSGTGEYIKVRWDILGPAHQGRVVFQNLNIRNQSSAAEEIGRRQLGEIMRAIGLASVQDTDQLVGGEAEIKVTVKQSDEYGPRNEVSATMPLAKGQLPQPVAASKPAMAAPAAAPSRAAPPWARKA